MRYHVYVVVNGKVIRKGEAWSYTKAVRLMRDDSGDR